MDSVEAEFSRRMAEALGHLAEVLKQRRIHYALIGGMACSFRGRPRFTKDLDFILAIPQISLPAVLEDLRSRGFTIDVRELTEQWTREHMVVLYYQGIRVDWLKPVLPLYQHVIDTAGAEDWRGESLRIASPEGIILTKLISSRRQDLLDIETLLAAYRGSLDLPWIKREWTAIADDSDPRFQAFQELVNEQKPSTNESNPPT